MTVEAATIEVRQPQPQMVTPHAARRGARVAAVPLIFFLGAVGILVCVLANAMSRATVEGPRSVVFWIGIMLIVVPVTYRLTAERPSRRERLLLVCHLGMALYAVKLARDPFGFTYPDELIHAYNALEVTQRGALFGTNPILEITPSYPGLQATTSALMQMTGLSPFGAGIVVIATARLIMMLALFVLFDVVSGSPRAAGLGVAVYTGAANFLYFNAQFAYESLALPVLVATLAVIAYSRLLPSAAWWLPVGLAILTVVTTHHLTSFGMVLALALLSVVHLAMRGRQGDGNPWRYAVLAAAAVGAWIVVVGDVLVRYLGPIFGRAVEGTVDTIRGESAPRQLFQRTEQQEASAPMIEQLLTFGSVLVLAAGLTLGLRRVWRHHRGLPLAVFLSLAGMGYFVTLVLRFAPNTWEIGNRASAFLFIGLGFVLGVSGVEQWRLPRAPAIGRVLVTVAIAVIIVGGINSGWPANTRLSQPTVVRTGDADLEAESLALGRWTAAHLPGRRFAAGEANARVLLLHGGVFAVAGSFPDIRDIVELPGLDPWMLEILQDNDLRFVVADRRRRGPNLIPNLAMREPFGPPELLRPPGVVDKFEQAGAPRIYDSGFTVVFDMAARR